MIWVKMLKIERNYVDHITQENVVLIADIFKISLEFLNNYVGFWCSFA